MAKFNEDRDDDKEENHKNSGQNKKDTNQNDEDKNQDSKDNEFIQKEISRLRRKKVVPLQQTSHLKDWLERKRKSRQSCRIVGKSRTGKTMACEAYKLEHKLRQEIGKPPIVPLIYIHPPQECSSRDLFALIIEGLKYKIVNGTVREIRERTLNILERCQVEMLIIDEADRLKPKTFADVRDISDKSKISVVLVGTDRLNAVVKRDEQVYNRFRACYEFKILSIVEFQKTVILWEKGVLKLPLCIDKIIENAEDIENMSNKDKKARKAMLKLLMSATGGYIGLLDMVLREAAIRALEKRVGYAAVSAASRTT